MQSYHGMWRGERRIKTTISRAKNAQPKNYTLCTVNPQLNFITEKVYICVKKDVLLRNIYGSKVDY